MEDAGAGRAIYPGAPPPPAQPARFSAKEEPFSGQLALELSGSKIPGLRIVSSKGERLLYSRDQSEIPRFLKSLMFKSMPDLVLQPSSTEAVSAAVRFAAAKGIPIIARGSGSSPFGGSVPVTGGIVLDMSRMDNIASLDKAAMLVTVQSGARWADIDNELQKNGMCLYTSPSSKFSSVGGWIATGGMGLNSFSGGHISNYVHSLELVDATGSVRTLRSGGEDFGAVFGSEGQLGIVTSVTIAVRGLPEKSRPHLFFFDDPRSAISFAESLASSGLDLAHIVYESSQKFALINKLVGGERFAIKDAILVNVEGEEAESDFQQLVRKTGLSEEKEYLARYMWNERFFPMKLRKFGPGMLGSEVVAPNHQLANLLEMAGAFCVDVGLVPLFEVHFLKDGKGLLLGYYTTDQGNTAAYTLDAVKSMLLTAKLIGLGAKPYSVGVWNHAFSDKEDALKVKRLMSVKKELDPKGVMNTGKYFSLGGRFGGLGGLLFDPKLMGPLLEMVLRVHAPSSSFFRIASRFSSSTLKPKSRTQLLETADECAMCGACVGVCPAYLLLGDERVTARGKLLTAKSLAQGHRISKEHSDRTFLCMWCKACEQVCQSKLELVSAYDTLEKELESAYGKDSAEIERFIRYAEATPEYDELIKRGLVIGAPKNGTGGARPDV